MIIGTCRYWYLKSCFSLLLDNEFILIVTITKNELLKFLPKQTKTLLYLKSQDHNNLILYNLTSSFDPDIISPAYSWTYLPLIHSFSLIYALNVSQILTENLFYRVLWYKLETMNCKLSFSFSISYKRRYNGK